MIGPTPDGGYHLLATSRPLPALFEDIPWSTPQTFESTLNRAESDKISCYQLPPLPDIDTEEDFESALRGPLGKRLKKFLKEETG